MKSATDGQCPLPGGEGCWPGSWLHPGEGQAHGSNLDFFHGTRGKATVKSPMLQPSGSHVSCKLEGMTQCISLLWTITLDLIAAVYLFVKLKTLCFVWNIEWLNNIFSVHLGDIPSTGLPAFWGYSYA
jgi:hypothetical protein